ncbi:hypothetical protein [Pleomorphochaeta sp. DL1XJH-081]|uniref:hypothetical protein n=1 Tax=Pleomorphochaeta sp. DL1XJH-081 TaxID=3409690 RepID=UPI003BB6E494
MKKNVVLAFLCIFLLIGLISCREANEFEETTLTVVNATDSPINELDFWGYYIADPRGEIVEPTVSEDAILPGEERMFGLPPVLSEGSSLRISASDNVMLNATADIIYEEGAEVTLILNPADSDRIEPYFTIEGGTFVK